MAVVGIGFDPGPGAGTGYRAGLDPRDTARLLLVGAPRVGGLALGLAALSAVIALTAADRFTWFGPIVAFVIGLVVFGRSRLVLDRRRHVLERGLWFAGVPASVRRTPLGAVRWVRLRRVEEAHAERRGRTSLTTTYHVDLDGGGPVIELFSAGVWEAAREQAEVVARHLGVGLDDQASGVRHAKDELDAPVDLAAARPAAESAPRKAWQTTFIAREAPDGTLHVSVPLPRCHHHLFLAGVGSSRVDLQACKLEYSIVSPK